MGKWPLFNRIVCNLTCRNQEEQKKKVWKKWFDFKKNCSLNEGPSEYRALFLGAIPITCCLVKTADCDPRDSLLHLHPPGDQCINGISKWAPPPRRRGAIQTYRLPGFDGSFQVASASIVRPFYRWRLHRRARISYHNPTKTCFFFNRCILKLRFHFNYV